MIEDNYEKLPVRFVVTRSWTGPCRMRVKFVTTAPSRGSVFFVTIRNQCYVAVEWSVESLPSNTSAWIRFAAGSEILISILGLGVCPLLCYVLCFLRRWPWHCADHTLREARHCVTSSVLSWSPLWSKGNIVTSHAVGPGSIPGRSVSWLWSFRGFPSTIGQMSANFSHIHPRLSYGHFIYGVPFKHPWFQLITANQVCGFMKWDWY